MFLSFSSWSHASSVAKEIQENAIASDIYSASLSQEEKNFLDPKIKDKRFVFLGEPDHYFEEKFSYRLKFIEHLLSQGFTHILDEMGVSDGEMVQNYLETGDEDYLKKLGLYGFKYGQALTESDRNFVRSSKRYLRKLRLLKLKHPKLIYGGFDLDIYPGTAYLQLDDFFKKYKFAFLNEFENSVNLSKSFSGGERLERLRKAYKDFLKVKYRLSRYLEEKELIHFQLILRNFVASVEIRERFSTSNYSKEDLVWREEQMFKNMLARFQLDPAQQKYVLLGHNGHLTKTVDQYLDLNGVQQWYAIGTWINDHFPKQAFGIWSLIGQGEHSGHGCENKETCYFSSPESTLEYELLKIETERSLLFSTQLPSLKNSKELIKFFDSGSVIYQGPLSLQADAIYFIPRVSDVGPLSEKKND